MDDDVILNINSDKYKYQYCSITNEECEGHSCQTCDVAIDEAIEMEKSTNVDIFTFKKVTKNGITVELNYNNTVLKCKTVDTFFKYVNNRADFTKYNKVKGAIGDDTIEYEYPHYNIILKKLNLKTCIESYYLKEYPYIAMHDDFVLVTSPRIHHDE